MRKSLFVFFAWAGGADDGPVSGVLKVGAGGGWVRKWEVGGVLKAGTEGWMRGWEVVGGGGVEGDLRAAGGGCPGE